LDVTEGDVMVAVMIGIDPHKGSHTTAAIDGAEVGLGYLLDQQLIAGVSGQWMFRRSWPPGCGCSTAVIRTTTTPTTPVRWPAEPDLHPDDQRQMVEEAPKGELRWAMLLDQLLLGQPIGLPQHRITLVVEVLHQQAELRTTRIRVDSHPFSLASRVKPMPRPA
jgi:hypothetical protein